MFEYFNCLIVTLDTFSNLHRLQSLREHFHTARVRLNYCAPHPRTPAMQQLIQARLLLVKIRISRVQRDPQPPYTH
jgi:hypothetical protein